MDDKLVLFLFTIGLLVTFFTGGALIYHFRKHSGEDKGVMQDKEET